MKILIHFYLILFPGFLGAQDFKLSKSIAIEEPTEISIDRAGNIYYASYNGDIIKYDPYLQEKLFFSPSNPNTVTILEAWQGLRIFSFHRDLQQYRLINRNLSLHEDYQFPKEVIGFAEIATPSFDNNIWVVDQMDFSLVKYDITSRRIMTRTTLDQLLDRDNYEILFIREYQNRLFLSTKNRGILIFDNLGTYLKKLEFENITFFNFYGNNLYLIERDYLVELDIYDDQINKRKLPVVGKWMFIAVYGERNYLFSKNKISLYQ